MMSKRSAEDSYVIAFTVFSCSRTASGGKNLAAKMYTNRPGRYEVCEVKAERYYGME